MKMTFRELMDKLGIGRALTPYETCPYNVYDGAQGITCNAEIRMGNAANAVEGEVQIMYDTPPAGEAPMKQILWFKVTPKLGDDWATREARLRGTAIDTGIYNWEEKCCIFFSELTRFMKMEQVPNIEELIEEVFNTRERFHDQHGGGGGKSPKIKPAQLLGIKKGQGF